MVTDGNKLSSRILAALYLSGSGYGLCGWNSSTLAGEYLTILVRFACSLADTRCDVCRIDFGFSFDCSLRQEVFKFDWAMLGEPECSVLVTDSWVLSGVFMTLITATEGLTMRLSELSELQELPA